MLRHCLLLLSLLLPAATSFAATNGELPPPPLRISLKLSWNDHGAAAQRRLSLQDIEALPRHSLTLALPREMGIEGTHTWEGVALSDLVASSGQAVSELKVMALNDYSMTIPVDDLKRFNPLLAYRRDGNPISVREKGPFIVIYPFDRFPELNAQLYLNRSVWQVDEIILD